ncbi:MAG: hypothetical protein JF887_06015 [Candidatus Dormibacteraeota bacterium]|uniref:Uncharacterized protein n=1 Tax=Candidatus Amunia macphersoniae TaxID=3127014 RepID=A0A934KHP2_9BACT|nr:hypothetical protein [Candidatus Dormibacteraeota bacterium]
MLFHPTAENVELRASAGGSVAITANSTTVGPGFHVFVSELAMDLGEAFRVEWDWGNADSLDETGYLPLRNHGAMESEMRAWLRGLARVIRDRLAANAMAGAGDGSINMPVVSDGFDHGQLLTTPMGPRDGTWLARVADDPAVGGDIWPWRTAGLGAQYQIGWAVARMWTDVRWRPPATDEERGLISAVLDHLEEAHRIDPTEPAPVDEWAELAKYLDRQVPPGLSDIDRSLNVRIGYRRFPTRFVLPAAWWVTAPGSFARSLKETGATQLWDGDHAVHVTAYSYGAPAHPPEDPSEVLATVSNRWGTTEILSEQELGLGRVAQLIQNPDDAGIRHLQGAAATAGSLAILTVTYPSTTEPEWATSTWRSLRRTSPPHEGPPSRTEHRSPGQ